jgi:hypothetical protein
MNIYDTNEQYIGNIICNINDTAYEIRTRIRNTLFIDKKDVNHSVWKCTLFRKDGDIFRVIRDEHNAEEVIVNTMIYATIRELHGITITTNPYDFQHYWDRHCQYGEEAFDYMIYNYDKMISSYIYEFDIITSSGISIISNVDNNIEQILMIWINLEKENGLFNSNEWKVYHQLIDTIECADEYLIYHKLFRFQGVMFELGIQEIVCYCHDKTICSYCKQTPYTECRFILREYGKSECVEHDNLFIKDSYWNFPY